MIQTATNFTTTKIPMQQTEELNINEETQADISIYQSSNHDKNLRVFMHLVEVQNQSDEI
jgi:hypothetical protein